MMNVPRVKFSNNNTIREFAPYLSDIKISRMRPTKYDPQNCEICKISCNSKKIFDMHNTGKKHLKALEKFSEIKFLCDICSSTFDDFNGWSVHLKSMDHIRAEQKSISINLSNTTLSQDLSDIHFCKICNLNCGSNIILQSHLTGGKHKRKLKLLQIEKLKEAKDSSVYCELCQITLEPKLMIMHKQSNKHRKMNVKENKIIPKSKNGMEYCAICNEDFTSTSKAVAHYTSSLHSENLEKSENNQFWCDVCKILLPNQSMLDIHLKGFRHYRILKREDCAIEASYKEKILNKRLKQRQLREEFNQLKLKNSEVEFSSLNDV